MKRALVLAWILVCGCRPATPVTPVGTVLFEWELAKAGRESVRAAKIGEKTAKDFVVHVLQTGSGGPPLDVALHVEFAPIEFEEGGKKESRTSPVLVRATVKNNDAWDSSRSHCDTSGPNYQMGGTNKDGTMNSPPAMIQSCVVSYHRTGGFLRHSSWELGVRLNIYGDGTVKPFPDDQAKIE